MDNENIDPYENYDEEDRAGMQAEGAQNVLDTLQKTLGPDGYKALQAQIAEGAEDPLAFKDRKEWTREEWGSQWADGKVRWQEIPDGVKEQMDLK